MIDLKERDENEYGESHYQISEWVLKTIFTIRRDHSLEDISERIGVSYSTMRKYRAGKMACPVEILKKTYLATRHPLLKELLEPEGFELQPKDTAYLTLMPTVEAHIIEAFGKITDLERSYRKAIEAGQITPDDYNDIRVKRGEAIDAIHRIFERIARNMKVRAVS